MVAALSKVEAGVEAGVERFELEFTREQVELIKHSVLKGGTDLELDLFLNWCRTKGLDPLSGEAYAVRQGGGLQPAAQIAGLRKIAARTGLYGPQDGPYWCGQDGEWTDVWLQDVPPAAAKVGVKQRGQDAYTYEVAHWRECGAPKAGRGGPWATQPAHMLAIRAEAGALRRVFPTDLGGVYIKDELGEEPPERRGIAARVHVEEGKPSALAFAEYEQGDDDIIDAETGEIEPMFRDEPKPVDRITTGQVRKIAELKAALHWQAADINETAGKLTGITNPGLLTVAQANALVDHMEAMALAAAEGVAR